MAAPSAVTQYVEEERKEMESSGAGGPEEAGAPSRPDDAHDTWEEPERKEASTDRAADKEPGEMPGEQDVLSRIAEAQRQGASVSSIYCLPALEPEPAPAKEPAKKRKRPPKPVEIGPDGIPIKRKRGRPRIHPVPVPVLGPDGTPIKRKRGRPRKNAVPEEGAGLGATPAAALPQTETPPAKRPRGRPRKTPGAEGASKSPGGEKRARGRPRKNPLTDSPSDSESPTKFLADSSDMDTEEDVVDEGGAGAGANGLVAVVPSLSSPTTTPSKKRRGRPRKNPMPLHRASGEASPAAAESGQRKRGRPRKQPAEGEGPVGGAPTAVDGEPTKRKRGRPSAANKEGPASSVPTPGKRRGRPPKVRPKNPTLADLPTPTTVLPGPGREAPMDESMTDSLDKAQAREAREEGESAGSDKFKLNISFSDASSDSEWSGQAKVSELTTRVVSGAPATGGRGAEGERGDDSSEESSYISDV